MTMTGADICTRLAQLAQRRADFELIWNQVADVAATDAPEQFGVGIGANSVDIGMHRASAARRSKNLYDSTASWAVDRLASGLEGLIMPQSETWHTLLPNDLFAMNNEATDEQVEWLEKLRDFMFRVRYDSSSGWQTAIQTALRRLVAFGNGLIFVEEGTGFGGPMVRYRHLPMTEVYLTEDVYGRVDGAWRVYQLTARQAKQKVDMGQWKTLPPTIAAAVNKPDEMDKPFRFIHCIYPRTDYDIGGTVDRAPWASVHVAFDDKVILGESGYHEFPIIDLRWLPEPGRVYGEGPVMRVLADVQSMNLMAKNEMIASQQAIDPPLLIARVGVVNRPDTNPGATILGGVDPQGRKMVQPLELGQRLDLARAVIQAKRENLKESLYINLFASMYQTQSRSATDALIKANEKGELLGPAGSRIQESLSRLVERELGILSRFGLFDRNSIFKPPQSLQGRNLGPKFTSPLDRLRRSKDAEAVIRTLEIVSPMANFDPGVFDNFDGDETTRMVADVLGVPRRAMKRVDEVKQIRAIKEQKQQAAEALAGAQAAAAAAADAAPALESLQSVYGNAA